MPHKYSTIPGWFDYERLYDKVVDEYEEYDRPGIFVEVGCWLGRSVIYLAEKIKESGKRIEVLAVDTWEGSDDEKEHKDYIAGIGGKDVMYNKFIQNTIDAGVEHIITPCRMNSQNILDIRRLAGYNRFFDFVFIDAQHSYHGVKYDIFAWYPKVVTGGIIAGHDYDINNPPSFDLMRAVHDVFGDKIETIGKCWVHKV